MKRKYIYISFFAIAMIITIISVKSTFYSVPNKMKTSQVDGKYNLGKRIYEKDCASCHDKKMIEYATAPPLGRITKLREKNWLYNYTRNSSKMHSDGDTIALKLRSENFGLMPSFPNLNDTKLDAVYYYIEKEYQKNKSQKTD